ncbi:MAG: hypothetical protein LBS59_06640 [Puniceicoccales bacterium]|nr:hypothetical protein [Puniceicoccales bacterium]
MKVAQGSEVVRAIIARAKKGALGETEKEREEAYKKFKDELGFDPEKDFNSITAGFWADKQSKGNRVDVFIGRGKFSPDKSNAYLSKQKNNVRPVKIAGREFFLVCEDLVVGFVDNRNVIYLRQPFPFTKGGEKFDFSNVEKVLEAFEKGKAYVAPKSLYKLEKSVEKPLFLAHVEVESSEAMKDLLKKGGSQGKIFQPIRAQLVASIKENKNKLRTIVQYDTPEKVAALNALIQMGVRTTKEGLAKDSTFLAGIVKDTKFYPEGSNLIIEYEQTTEEILKALENLPL